jgi:hypothetical protein
LRAVFVLVSALLGGGCGDDFHGGGADSDSDTDTDTDVDTDADSDTDSCAAIDDGPFELTRLAGPIASEDLAFDDEGNVVGSDGVSALFKSPIDGPPEHFASIVQQAGLRYLPSGVLVVADDEAGDLILVQPDGTEEVLLADMDYPNGIAIGLDGFAYVTEKNSGSVRRIDPETGEFTFIVSGSIVQPNGIAFSPDYRTLYIAGTSAAGIVHRISIDEDGGPGGLEELVRGVGRGRLDGLAVDACGNVYVCDYGSGVDDATLIYRISADGERARLISDSGGAGSWTFFANMDFGTGIGGWNPTSLYFAETSSQSVFEMEIGVPSKPRPYP